VAVLLAVCQELTIIGRRSGSLRRQSSSRVNPTFTVTW
jgi:hypothetical protein